MRLLCGCLSDGRVRIFYCVMTFLLNRGENKEGERKMKKKRGGYEILNG